MSDDKIKLKLYVHTYLVSPTEVLQKWNELILLLWISEKHDEAHQESWRSEHLLQQPVPRDPEDDGN